MRYSLVMLASKGCVSSRCLVEDRDIQDNPLSTDPYIAIHTILWIPPLHPITPRLRRRWSIIHWWGNINRTWLNVHRNRLYIIGIHYYATWQGCGCCKCDQYGFHYVPLYPARRFNLSSSCCSWSICCSSESFSRSNLAMSSCSELFSWSNRLMSRRSWRWLLK